MDEKVNQTEEQAAPKAKVALAARVRMQSERAAEVILGIVPKLSPGSAKVTVTALVADAIERALDPAVAAARALEDANKAQTARQGYKLPPPTEK